ncbi:MAG: hypothetical protein KDA61_21480, partial [Planctomycetales bacterium]|nr:hypothetical protein [Planctomycetales bacterium]
MSASDPIDAVSASWRQLEEVIQRLHDAARTASSPEEFFRQLIQETSAALGGLGGAVWQRHDATAWRLLGEWPTGALTAAVCDAPSTVSDRRVRVEQAARKGRAFYDAGDDSKTESDTSGEVTRRELRRDCLYVPTPSSGGTPAEASWTLE